jgi:hypothetical protein
MLDAPPPPPGLYDPIWMAIIIAAVLALVAGSVWPL